MAERMPLFVGFHFGIWFFVLVGMFMAVSAYNDKVKRYSKDICCRQGGYRLLLLVLHLGKSK